MSLPLHDLFALGGAVVLAALGGELFLKGILATATRLRLPALLVATTLAAFATSSPELTVSISAALQGQPEIGLGDAIGSNVVNIALIFGLALLFGPMQIRRQELGRDYALALSIPLLTLFFLVDGHLSRSEGGILLATMAGWVILLTRHALRSASLSDAQAVPTIPVWRILLMLACGLAALIGAGQLFVTGAGNLAARLGIDGYVIGSTVVAIGTSLPELVTVLLARWRKHDDISVGTLIGSNIFNGLSIVGIAAGIHPVSVPPAEAAVGLGIGFFALLLLYPGKASFLGRGRGIALLLTYLLFILLTLAVARGT